MAQIPGLGHFQFLVLPLDCVMSYEVANTIKVVMLLMLLSYSTASALNATSLYSRHGSNEGKMSEGK